MRALIVVLSLLSTPKIYADMMFDTHALFGFNLGQNWDAHRKYEQRHLAAVGILNEKLGLHESARVVVNFGYADVEIRSYLIEVKFCLRSNSNVCLDERLARSFTTNHQRPLKQEFYFISLGPETLTTIAKLAARNELVIVTSAAAVTSPWFWPNQVLGTSVVNFNDLIRREGHEEVLPLERQVLMRMRFEPTREL